MKPGIRVFTIAAAFALGCGGDDHPTVPEIEIYRPQNSIENVLHNLVQAYERRDIAAYEKLFPDEFFFAFDPEDVIENADIPVEWDLKHELESTSNMFTEPLVENITLDFLVGEPVAAVEADILRHPFPAGTMTTTISEVELSVDTRDPEGGENIMLQVTGDQAIFFLYPHSTETVSGLPIWYIIEWRDRKIGSFASDGSVTSVTSAAGLTRSSSWGAVKNNYR